jgi:hypothetical protein
MVVILLLCVLTACAKDDDQTSASVPDGPEEVLLASTSLTPDENRLAIVLRTGPTRYEDATSVHVAARPITVVETAWEGDAVAYQDFEGTYWVVFPKFTEVDDWSFDVTVTSKSGDTITQSLVATVYDAPIGVSIGESAPLSETFLWDAPDQPERITTDTTPIEAYYQMTVADAVSNGRPSVIIFATPGLCSRKLCGPTVDSLDPAWERYGDRVNFVHVEVYNLDTGEFVPAFHEWELEEKPWIYLVNSSGTVVTRYDGIVGFDELSPALDDVLTETG